MKTSYDPDKKKETETSDRNVTSGGVDLDIKLFTSGGVANIIKILPG